MLNTFISSMLKSLKDIYIKFYENWHFESEIQKGTSYGIFAKIYSVYWTINAMIISSYHLAKWEVN